MNSAQPMPPLWVPGLYPGFDFSGLTYDDVLLRPQKSSLRTRADADLTSEFLGWELNVPFIAAPMPSVVGSLLAYKLHWLGGLAVLHRFCTISEQFEEFEKAGRVVAVSIGIHDGIERTYPFVGAGCTTFVLDVAHAHSDPVIDFVGRWVNQFGTVAKLVVGNVATGIAARELVEAGADAIKVGIGPGSVCTTRQVTGFGVPQLEAISDVKLYLWDTDVPIIADGGIKNSGDIVKALAAGADVVMIGSLFAHSQEAPNLGTHYGCASLHARDSHAPEGTSMKISDKEPLEDIVNRLAGGLRSGISYGGATNIKELREKAQWIKISDAGRKESKL